MRGKLFKAVISLVLFGVILSSCSQTQDKKSINDITSEPLNTSETGSNRDIAGNGPFDFPLSDDPVELSRIQDSSYITNLFENLTIYRRVYGTFPDGLESYLRSGVAIHWPRNIHSGEPVLVNSVDLKAEFADFGKVLYQKSSENDATIKYVTIDYDTYQDTGKIKWIVNKVNFHFRLLSEYENESIVELREAVKSGPFANEREGLIDIMGGTTPVNFVTSDSERLIYGTCGHLVNQFVRSSARYYSHEQRFMFPDQFLSLYDGTLLIVADNFSALSDKLNISEIEFKMGFDPLKNAQYSWLAIDNNEYIAFCRFYNYETSSSIDNIDYQYNGEVIDDDPDFLKFKSLADMSSPLLAGDNMEEMIIPPELITTIDEILSN